LSAGGRLENECNIFTRYYRTCGSRIKKSNQIGGETRVVDRWDGEIGKGGGI